jgi:hypothetical protein
MDLNNPALDDLKELYAACKDKNDNHILWVCSAGKVHIDRLPANVDPETFEQEKPEMKVRFKTYHRGKGYVGKKAAADEHFMSRMYQTLLDQWRKAQQSSSVRYVETF